MRRKRILLFLIGLFLFQPKALLAENKISCNSIFLDDPATIQRPAFTFLENNYEVAHKYEILNRQSEAKSNAFSRNPLRITVWNTFKWQRENISKDLTLLSEISNLLLTQEAVITEQSKNIFNGTEKEWWMANSFYNANDIPTGVATGSSAQAQSVRFIQSEAREPMTRTPKMVLLSQYNIDGSSESLLVINVHMINFVFDRNFESMLEQIDHEIKAHAGPIIFAGDFNTWSASRMKLLRVFAAKHGMIHAAPSIDPRMLQLDHLFVRGFKVNRAQVLNRFESSDHYPLYFELELISPDT